MKPIHLTLAGLQSYRDKQEVDFTSLSDAGVFGIFGPTGSGKSSILDAITLALYGKVERAPGGTQGIINQMESVCGVSFTFELTSADGAERYRVDRQYKRTGEISVNQTLSRLMRLDAGEAEVLADKAKDVDNRIQEILGLSMADFTRAVVLPQGKFAEFLSLKGVERRHMLERLFHLEQYGDQLAGKVSVAARETDMAVKRTEAEQLGLGDASALALEAAKVRLEEAAKAARLQRELLFAAEKEAEDRRRLWKLILEQAAAAADEGKLLEKLPELEAGKLRLALAEKASRVEHFLAEWEAAKLELSKAEARAVRAEGEHQAASEAYNKQLALYEEAKTRLEREGDPLQSRIDGLGRAVELHAEIRQGEAQISGLAAREESLARELETASTQAAKERQLLEKATALQAELKAQLASKTVDPERRERLQAALLENEKHIALQSQAEGITRELQETQAQALPLRQAVQELESRLLSSITLSSALAEQGMEGLQNLDGLYRSAATLERLAASGEEAARRREQEHFRATLASQLAVGLTEGEPCPVCGSAHHPAPQKQDEVPEERAVGAGGVEGWRSIGSRASSVRLTVQGLSGLLEAEWSKLQKHASPDIPAETSASDLVSSLKEAAAAITEGTDLEADVPVDYQQVEELLSELNLKVSEADKDIRKWLQDIQKVQDLIQADRSRQGELQAKLGAMELNLAKLQAKHEDAEAKRDTFLQQWSARFADLEPAQVAVEWDKLQVVLREQDELRSRLAKSEPFLESQHQKINQLREESFRLERELVGVSTERKGLDSLLQQKRRRLTEQLGSTLTEAQTQALFQQATAELQAIKTAEVEGRRRLDSLQESLQAFSNGLAAARQGLASAAEALERARANGLRELAEAGFETADAARAAVLDANAAAKLAEEVKQFQDRLAEARAKRKQLEEAIGGSKVTEEEWQASEVKLAAERSKDEENLEARAKAERDLEELEAKHERWLLLEKERHQSQTLLSRLQKLQSVLRGNAFVEYMAEEQLRNVSRAASERLSQLTRRRYALETDSTGGFVIRDDANGGLRRPVSTLSGGETFLTSLSLALALSAQIQLVGKFPLEFFFLDEGFGTLDPDLLETVVNALEKLHMEQLTVGVISHVPELKARLPRRLVVTPADNAGSGSKIHFETL
jgi:DNA repair protein SbcC/Rad50